jgi:hypothetical protein
MKTIIYSIAFAIIIIILFSCDKNINNPSLEEFCSVAPNGWECELIINSFIQKYIPQNADTPIAIIKYKNPSREFTRFDSTKVNPSLILDLYPILQKEELIDFIKSQQMYSWCIPMYYGETKDYFIITSPCFINSGSFTDEADSCISDLHKALESLITTNDYNLLGI